VESIRRPPRSRTSRLSAAYDVSKRQILYLTLGSLLPNNIYAQDLQSYSGKVCNTTYKAPIERSEGFF
ncbi:hypothetical protein BGV07_07995, partial [Clostridioides difficile]